jgi:hypothetical protein
MRLSYLLAALTGIVYAAIQLGLNWSMNVVWWGVIVSLVVYILEGLAVGVPAVDFRRRRHAE